MNELKELANQIDDILYDCDMGSVKDCTAINKIMQLITTYASKKELEARLDELQTQFYWISQFNQDVAYNLEKRITQLQSQLTNNEKGIEK